MAAIFRANVRRAMAGSIPLLQTLIEIVKRSLLTAGHGRRPFEDGFHIVIVISIEPTNLLWFFGTLHLSGHVPVLRTVVRLNRQSAVGPQLPLCTAPVRGLHCAHSSQIHVCLRRMNQFILYFNIDIGNQKRIDLSVIPERAKRRKIRACFPMSLELLAGLGAPHINRASNRA